MPAKAKLNFAEMHAKLNILVSEALATNRKIVFLDEVCFTSKTLKTREFSNMHFNIEVE